MKNDKLMILTGWVVYKINGSLLISGTHYRYLKFLCKKFLKVTLLCRVEEAEEKKGFCSLDEFENFNFVAVPYYKTHASAIFNTLGFMNVIAKFAKGQDVVYSRVPDPFFWLPAFFTKGKVKFIFHFVGDPLEILEINHSLFNKIKASIYRFELLILKQMIKMKDNVAIFSNGQHLTDRLRNLNINSETVVSSTIEEGEFNLERLNENYNKKISLGTVSYLRKEKNIKSQIIILKNLIENNIDATLTIIGDGPDLGNLKKIVKDFNLADYVKFLGHIDNRHDVYEELDKIDFFLLTSFSEGSPRVVIEAASRGCTVVSYPVGSLPYTFTCDEIYFIDDELQGARTISDIVQNNSRCKSKLAFEKVKNNYTIEKFLSKVFNIE